jgi:hypothetical protein
MDTSITVTDGAESIEPEGPARCPFCAAPAEPGRLCRHVRWTFDQGGPLDFALFAVETSPYTQARGHSAREITAFWLEEKGEWIVERVLHHFEAKDGFVFGQLSDVDLLARDIWREFHPEAERPQMARVDPV